MLWLAGVVMALAWLLRPAPDAQTVRPIASAYLPVPGAPEHQPSTVFEVGPFDPAADLAPITVSPFVEHAWRGEILQLPPERATSEQALPWVPIPMDQVPLPLATPTTIEEWEPWIRSRPVVEAYPQLTGMLRDALERDLKSGVPGAVPMRAEALTEQYAHEVYGWARSAWATPIGTPTDPGVLDTRPYPYNSP